MMETYSYSDIANYLQCPRSVLLRRSGLPTADNDAMRVGRAVHQIQEFVVERQNDPPDIQQVCAVFTEIIERSGADLGDPNTARRIEKCAAGLPWLINVLPSPARRYLATETQFEVFDEIDGERVRIIGHPDLLYEFDGELWIDDLKTGRTSPRSVITDLQVNVYARLVSDTVGRLVTRAAITNPYRQEAFTAALDQRIVGATWESTVRPALRGMLTAVWPCNPAHVYGCAGCLVAEHCTFGQAALERQGDED